MNSFARLGILALAGVSMTMTLLHAQESDTGPALAKRVATACGVDNWPQIASLRFTWRHLPSKTDRGYDWDIAAGTVKVTIAAKTTKVPVGGWGPNARPSSAQLAAHKAWVNDGFWYLSALHLAWDKVAGFDDLGQVDVPQLPKLGKRRALRVRYGAQGGYTPGDHYVFYLGDDDRPVAWAFHKAGAKVPKLVTTWTRYIQIGRLNLPTRFSRADGTLIIGIEGMGVSTRKRGPASRPAKGNAPASRPASQPADEKR